MQQRIEISIIDRIKFLITGNIRELLKSQEGYSVKIKRKRRTWSKNLREKVYQKSNHVCHYCESKFKSEQLTLDHFIPLSKGGEDCFDNLKTACKRCNFAKKGIHPLKNKKEYQGFLEKARRIGDLRNNQLNFHEGIRDYVKNKDIDMLLRRLQQVSEKTLEIEHLNKKFLNSLNENHPNMFLNLIINKNKINVGYFYPNKEILEAA